MFFLLFLHTPNWNSTKGKLWGTAFISFYFGLLGSSIPFFFLSFGPWFPFFLASWDRIDL